MTVSKFLQNPSKTYIEEAANYLEARGLTIQDTPILPYLAVNHGHYTKTPDGGYQPLILEGWAYFLRGADGEVKDNEYLLRICNRPHVPVYQIRGKKETEVELPKFLQTNRHPVLHVCGAVTEFHQAPTIMIHEKISSCALAYKTLGVPSVAMSGCTGWGKGGKIHPELASLLGIIPPEAVVLVCLDGDIQSNSNITRAAGQFLGAAKTQRPDLNIIFPQVPENTVGVGWDDWAMSVGRENLADEWLRVLAENHVEIYDIIPLPDLVREHGVMTKSVKDVVQLAHTTDNYLRLLNHPRWVNHRRDLYGDVYDGTDYVGGIEEFRVHFRVWLERSVCAGYGEKVSSARVSDAIEIWGRRPRVNMALELLRTQPPVREDEARLAAHRLVTDGLQVVGPMTREETVETVLRIFRDMALRWGDDPADDVQWVWSLIGPSGCGKSKFPETLLSSLKDMGYRQALTTQLEKVGSRASFVEYARVARDNLVAIVDDYNAGEQYAKDVENEIYQLTSARTTIQRRMREEEGSLMTLHAVYFLTTTDTNREFLRSNEGSGERRFIPMEVRGHVQLGARMVGDRDVIKECGRTLLTWAAHGGTVEGVATEYSERYIYDYIQRNAAVSSLGEGFRNWKQVETDMKGWYREVTNDYRFSPPMLSTLLFPGERMTQRMRHDLAAFYIKCGAEPIGKARVNTPAGEVIKDGAMRVPADKMPEFLAALQAI